MPPRRDRVVPGDGGRVGGGSSLFCFRHSLGPKWIGGEFPKQVRCTSTLKEKRFGAFMWGGLTSTG